MTMSIVIHTFWCLAVFLVCTVAVPTWMTETDGHALDRMSRGGLKAGAFWVLSVFILGAVKCYNIATVIGLAACFFLIYRSRADGLSLRITVMGLLERGRIRARATHDAFRRPLQETMQRHLRHGSWIMQHARALARVPAISLFFVQLAVGVGVLSFASHLVHMHHTRLVHSDEYLCLIRTRQLLLNAELLGKPLLVPAIASGTTLISSAEPANVIRSLALIMPVLVTLVLGRVAFLLTGSLLASSAAMYCQNVAVLPGLVMQAAYGLAHVVIRSPNQATTGAGQSLEMDAALLFLLLWTAVLLRTRKITQREVLTCSLACAIALGASEPVLLLCMPLVGLMCLTRRPRVFFLIESTLFVAAVLIWPLQDVAPKFLRLGLLPCALGVLAGLAVWSLEVGLVSLVGLLARPIVAIAGIGVAFLWLPLIPEGGRPLQYDSVAIATNAISQQFTRQRWSVAAPVDQFAEVYSLGGFEDLAALVSSAPEGDLSKSPELDESVDDVFIFVEKTPLTLFDREPDAVPFSVLTDTTYRYYRSPAGRSSLEARALQICERYKSAHSNMSTFYEDEYIRVYRLSRSHGSLDKMSRLR